MPKHLALFALLVFFNQSVLAIDDKYVELDSYQFERKSTAVKPTPKSSNKKPELADFASYNDFLNAMYVYEKSQAFVTAPSITINLPSPQQNMPEYSTVESTMDIGSWGEDITTPATPSTD